MTETAIVWNSYGFAYRQDKRLGCVVRIRTERSYQFWRKLSITEEIPPTIWCLYHNLWFGSYTAPKRIWNGVELT